MASGVCVHDNYLAKNYNSSSGSKQANYIDAKFDVFLHPDKQPLLNRKQLIAAFPKFLASSKRAGWSPQASGPSIPPEIASKLEEMWAEHLSTLPDKLKLQARTLPNSNATDGGVAEDNESRLLEDCYLRCSQAQWKVVQQKHNQLSNGFADWLREAKASNVVQEKNCVDIRCKSGGSDYLFELKVCYLEKTRHALRDALGQVLEYRFYPGNTPARFVGIVLDQPPSAKDIDWFQALRKSVFPIELVLAQRGSGLLSEIDEPSSF